MKSLILLFFSIFSQGLRIFYLEQKTLQETTDTYSEGSENHPFINLAAAFIFFEKNYCPGMAPWEEIILIIKSPLSIVLDSDLDTPEYLVKIFLQDCDKLNLTIRGDGNLAKKVTVEFLTQRFSIRVPRALHLKDMIFSTRQLVWFAKLSGSSDPSNLVIFERCLSELKSLTLKESICCTDDQMMNRSPDYCTFDGDRALRNLKDSMDSSFIFLDETRNSDGFKTLEIYNSTFDLIFSDFTKDFFWKGLIKFNTSLVHIILEKVVLSKITLQDGLIRGFDVKPQPLEKVILKDIQFLDENFLNYKNDFLERERNVNNNEINAALKFKSGHAIFLKGIVYSIHFNKLLKIHHGLLFTKANVLVSIEDVAISDGLLDMFPLLVLGNGNCMAKNIYIYNLRRSFLLNIWFNLIHFSCTSVVDNIKIYDIFKLENEKDVYPFLLMFDSKELLLKNSFFQGPLLSLYISYKNSEVYNNNYFNNIFHFDCSFDGYFPWVELTNCTLHNSLIRIYGSPVAWNRGPSLSIFNRFISVQDFNVHRAIYIFGCTFNLSNKIIHHKSLGGGFYFINCKIISLDPESDNFIYSNSIDDTYMTIKNLELSGLATHQSLFEIKAENGIFKFNVENIILSDCSTVNFQPILTTEGVNYINLRNFSIKHMKKYNDKILPISCIVFISATLTLNIQNFNAFDVESGLVNNFFSLAGVDHFNLTHVNINNVQLESIGGLVFSEENIISMHLSQIFIQKMSAREGIIIHSQKSGLIHISNLLVSQVIPIRSGSLFNLEAMSTIYIVDTKISFLMAGDQETARYGNFINAQDSVYIILIKVTICGARGLSYGGVFDLKKNNVLTVMDSEIIDALAQLAGGILSATSNNTISFINTSFINVTSLASEGGGFYLDIENSISIHNCLCKNFSCSMEGGVLSLKQGNRANITDSVVDKVSGGIKGGSLSIYSGNTVFLVNVKFLGNNFVKSEGNFVYLNQENYIFFKACKFDDFEPNFKPVNIAAFISINQNNIIFLEQMKLERILDCMEFLKSNTNNSITIAQLIIIETNFSAPLFNFLFHSNKLTCNFCYIKRHLKANQKFFYSSPKFFKSNFLSDQVSFFDSKIIQSSGATLFDISDCLLNLKRVKISLIGSNGEITYQTLKARRCIVSFIIVCLTGATTESIFAPLALKESTLEIRKSFFLGNSNHLGVGGVFSLISSNVTCLESYFISNRARFGGVFSLINFNLTFVITNNKFLNNYAVSFKPRIFPDEFLSFEDKELETSQKIDESVAYSKGRGGCFYIRDFSEDRYLNFSIKNNKFHKSKAPIGGLLFHQTFPGNNFLIEIEEILKKNTFHQISAYYYGDILATNTFKLDYFIYPPFEKKFTEKALSVSRSLTLKNFTYGRLYNDCLATFYGADYYGQISYASEVFYKIDKGKVNVTFTNGDEEVFIYQSGNDSKISYFQNNEGIACIKAVREGTSVAVDQIFELENIAMISLPAEIENFPFNFSSKMLPRKCLKGEVANKQLECETCPIDFYSTTENFEAYSICERCHDGLDFNCYGDNKFSPKPGFWRISQNSNQYLKCPYERACLGDIYFNTEEAGLIYDPAVARGFCSLGYKGILCLECEHDYGQSDKYRCSQCGKAAEVAILIIKILLKFSLTLIFVYNQTMISYIESLTKRKEKLETISKGAMISTLLLYFQVLNLFQELPINFTSEIRVVISTISTPIAPEVSYIFNMECIFKLLDISYPVQYGKVLVSFLFYTCVFLILMIFLPIKLYKLQNKAKHIYFTDLLKKESLGLFIIILKNIWVASLIDLIQVLIESLRCENFSASEPGFYRLLRDLQIECDKGIFRDHTLYLIIPLLLLITVIIPIGMFTINFLSKKGKFTLHFKEIIEANFSDEIFEKRCSYYKIITISRTILILTLNIFTFSFSTINSINLPINNCFILLVVLFVFLILNNNLTPYTKKNFNFMNNLEGWTFASLLCNNLCAIIYFLVETKTLESIIAIGFFVLAINTAYFIYFAILFWKKSGIKSQISQTVSLAKKSFKHADKTHVIELKKIN